MISLQSLGVEFGARPLFSDATFVVGERDRIALVGKNGAGKSTLLKIIAGKQQPTAGVVSVQRGVSVGYLPQVMVLTDGRTVKAEAMTAYDEMLSQMSAEDRESEQPRLEAKAERTLTCLGFHHDEMDRPTSTLSGGWRMRIELAKLLLQEPDVLLLDEPTNHLDIESITWLEQFLARRAGALILVSHDRAFISNVTNRTIEITCGKLTDYRVKYDEYVKLREERREQQIRAYENQQKEIADTREFIERFRYKPSKAVQVQSRIKALEKIVPIEIDEIDTQQMHLRFPPCQRSGDFPLICEGVGKAFPQKRVFADVNLQIRRGEKVAFVGRNGEGKTTLVKCIMGQLDHEGTLKVGHGVQIGYFAQNQAWLLDDEQSVFDTIDRVAVGEIRTKIRNLLGCFMFGSEDIDKKVRVLSGGERSRLAMIQLLLQPVNLLILDEPTNHLDMRSKDVLKEAIRSFDGTAIIVSHDRNFLDGLVEKVYEFGEGKVREHLGGIYDFLHRKGIDSLRQLENGSTLNSKQTINPERKEASDKAGSGKQAYLQQKAAAKARKALEKAVLDAEEEVMQLESALHILEEQMATPEGAADATLFEKYSRLKAQKNKAEEDWTKAVESLESEQ